MQLLFGVETNSKTKSDEMYIASCLNAFYEVGQSEIKLSFEYMNGKGNYQSSKFLKKIENTIKKYNSSKSNSYTKVILCFDCDEMDTNPIDKEFIENAKNFCDSKDFDFVWFKRDIEEVFTGNRVLDNEKRKTAESYLKTKKILKIDKTCLRKSDYISKSSNLMLIIDKYLKTKSNNLQSWC